MSFRPLSRSQMRRGVRIYGPWRESPRLSVGFPLPDQVEDRLRGNDTNRVRF